MRQSTFPGELQGASPERVFLLNLILAILRAPLKRMAELLGLEARPAERSPSRADEEPSGTEDEPSPDHPARPPEAAPTPLRARPGRSPAPPPPERARIKEVDEEPVLTAEFAEEGAEYGAGAEVHVDEPWEGYRDMKVAEVTSRLASASPTELAAVQLFESSHRKRRSVLDAAERRLRSQQV